MSKIVDKTTKFLMWVGCAIFAIVVIIVVVNVLGRRILNLPVKGATELVQYGVMLAIGLVMARTGFEGRHINVNILINRFSPTLRQVFIAFGALCGTATFAVLGYLFISEMPTYFGNAGRMTEAWRIPYYVIYAIMGIGFVIATLEYLYEFVLSVKKIFNAASEPEAGGDAENGEGGA